MDKIFYSFFNEDNIENIITGLANKKEYICTIPYPDRTSELLLSRVVTTFLKDLETGYNEQKISIIINELINTVNRINLIEEYFNEKKLDITNYDDYNNGLEELKNGSFFNSYTGKNHYIKIRIAVGERELYVSIENDRPLTALENESYKNLLLYSENIDSMETLFYDNPNIADRLDFGLILSVIMLKQLNIDTKSLLISSKDNKTFTELTIPFLQLSKEVIETITDELANEIDHLPQLPESITRLQREISDKNWDYEHIADSILSDTSLTTEILRLVNSPSYRVGDKIEKISLAVKK